ncbi:MAG: FtsX-like permease family protein [Bdellovibrionota bacterium]|nr:MAG: FtsX-like permease family protein [Bdellovibrionota bacterium]
MNWMLRLAYRDARWGLSRVASAYLALVLGVAALVAILGVEEDIRASIFQNTRNLLGSDIEFSSKRPLSATFLSELGPFVQQQAHEVRFRTMATAPESKRSRLVQLQAVDDGFPFYGSVTTSPPGAWQELQSGEGSPAVVEETLVRELDLSIGSTLKVGPHTLRIIGVVHDAPGLVVPAYVISPRVFISYAAIKDSPLLTRGALADYYLHSQLRSGTTTADVSQHLQAVLAAERIEARTHQQRAEVLGQVYSNVGQFLSLAAFVALLIGAAAAVASTHIYLQQKFALVAILRCLGASRRESTLLCLLEVAGLAFLASLLGVGLGLGAQYGLAALLHSLVPSEIDPSPHLPVVAAALLVGVGTVTVYALPLMARLNHVSPLQVLRPNGLDEVGAARYRAGTMFLVIVITVAFGFLVAESTKAALISIGIALGGLAMCALLGWLLLYVARRIPESLLPFLWRHGIKNLMRPGNATLPLIMALGTVGIFSNLILICGHFLTLHTDKFRHEQTPNVFLYDIQSDQREPVRTVLHQLGAKVLQETPVVMMRLQSVKGRPVGELLAAPSNTIPSWALTREYWSSYREQTVPNETVIAGQWVTKADPGDDRVAVSVEDRMAERLGIKLGDELVFDVHNRPLVARVTSLRTVHWERMERNALMVFPSGILEDVPQSRFISAHIATEQKTADVQTILQERFPNVSMVDLRLVLRAIDKLVERIGWALAAVTGLIAFAALLAIVGLGIAGREVRYKELTLLRALGARRRQVQQLVATEYAVLAILGVTTGLAISVVSSRFLASELFRSPFSLPLSQILAANLLLAVSVIVTVSWLHRGARNQSVQSLIQSE